jgi:UDPglucose--hexose-1-phosphate uridylyltransferase
MIDLKKDVRFKYLMIFKNQGEAAGASLEHSHSQLIATPVIPKRVQEELEGSEKYFEYKERCIFCDIMRQELSSGQRIVMETEKFVALEPFAPRFPFETWVLPKKHDNNYINISDDLAEDFSRTLKAVLGKLKAALSDPPYNYVLHTDAFSGLAKDYYHWHLEIIPKLTKIAGFEWGTGFYINPVAPEDAATYLRDIEAK